MERISIVAALILMGAVASPAVADTFRCKSSLIQTGATSGYVLERCGDPSSKETITEPVRTIGARGAYQVGTTSKEVWRYRRAGKFQAVMTFEEGVLRKLEFEK